jgi:hypothetical protein
MLIEELFSRGIMTMGPSRMDPTRQVGIFSSNSVSTLPGLSGRGDGEDPLARG